MLWGQPPGELVLQEPTGTGNDPAQTTPCHLVVFFFGGMSLRYDRADLLAHPESGLRSSSLGICLATLMGPESTMEQHCKVGIISTACFITALGGHSASLMGHEYCMEQLCKVGISTTPAVATLRPAPLQGT